MLKTAQSRHKLEEWERFSSVKVCVGLKNSTE